MTKIELLENFIECSKEYELPKQLKWPEEYPYNYEVVKHFYENYKNLIAGKGCYDILTPTYQGIITKILSDNRLAYVTTKGEICNTFSTITPLKCIDVDEKFPICYYRILYNKYSTFLILYRIRGITLQSISAVRYINASLVLRDFYNVKIIDSYIRDYYI